MKSVLFLTFCLCAAAPLAARADEPKIAYVDMQQVLNNVEEGRAAKDRLKKEFESKQKKLDALQNELKGKKDEFDKKAAMMKDDVRQQKQEELQKSFVEL